MSDAHLTSKNRVAEWLREKGRQLNQRATDYTRHARGARTTVADRCSMEAALAFEWADEIGRLPVETADVRDAERYRWLREQCDPAVGFWWAVCPPAPAAAIRSASELDESIDRARASEEPSEPQAITELCPKCSHRMFNWPGRMTKCNKCLHEWYMDTSNGQNGEAPRP